MGDSRGWGVLRQLGKGYPIAMYESHGTAFNDAIERKRAPSDTLDAFDLLQTRAHAKYESTFKKRYPKYANGRFGQLKQNLGVGFITTEVDKETGKTYQDTSLHGREKTSADVTVRDCTPVNSRLKLALGIVPDAGVSYYVPKCKQCGCVTCNCQRIPNRTEPKPVMSYTSDPRLTYDQAAALSYSAPITPHKMRYSVRYQTQSMAKRIVDSGDIEVMAISDTDASTRAAELITSIMPRAGGHNPIVCILEVSK